MPCAVGIEGPVWPSYIYIYTSQYSTFRAAKEEIEADAHVIVNRKNSLCNYIAADSFDNACQMNWPFLRKWHVYSTTDRDSMAETPITLTEPDAEPNLDVEQLKYYRFPLLWQQSIVLTPAEFGL